MSTLINRHQLEVPAELAHFIDHDVLPGLPVSAEDFWRGFSDLLTQYHSKNQRLLAERDRLQHQIDQWHRDHPGPIADAPAYQRFLEELGYIQADPGAVAIDTDRIDAEIAHQAGPQLVVPVMNARYALNAANARYGSLYDALYGTDAIDDDDGAERTGAYNPKRGAKVIQFAKRFLDHIAPLSLGSHQGAVGYTIDRGQLMVHLNDGTVTTLQHPQTLIGCAGEQNTLSALVLKHNELHVIVEFDRKHPVGSQDPAGIKDLVLESALTTILDFEDSIAAVDAEDKVMAYRNLLGIFKGTLSETVQKGSTRIERRLNPDRQYLSLNDQPLRLPGRSLLFIRNVGHLMTTPAILVRDQDGVLQEAYEGLVDAMITTAIAQHDVLGHSPFQNSRAGSIYIVKPKMHGPAEVAFCNEVFGHVERVLKLNPHTVKIGIMDEERRTSVNLRACIQAAQQRVAFINTGFLDRTGDEIHTAMHAGAVIRKHEMRSSPWLTAYEKLNVWAGLSCGLMGRAQIGKGMWAMPDLMKAMLEQKIAHPTAGANTAWVPSPTAATLHALHYHQVHVASIQQQMLARLNQEPIQQWRQQLLTVPVAQSASWSDVEKQEEVDNNVQGILGYVVRWVEQGIGCSKVPDIRNVGLMEDRATLRISSQHLANWLAHGVISADQVRESFNRMASVVDQQNATDPTYRPMVGRQGTSPAFQAALDLVFKGQSQPNGYTEPLLHAWRLRAKATRH